MTIRFACGIPPQVIENLKQERHQNFRSAHEQSARLPRRHSSTGPSLSDALSTPVPNSNNIKTGRGTFDTLTGNPLGKMSEATGRVADATGNWVDGLAPALAAPICGWRASTGRSAPGCC